MTTKMKERLHAESVYQSDPRKPDTVAARVPREVRRFFQVRDGDVLEFDEGCERSHQRAALSGEGYLIVTIRRVQELPAIACELVVEEEAQAPTLPSLADVVARRLEGKGE